MAKPEFWLVYGVAVLVSACTPAAVSNPIATASPGGATIELRPESLTLNVQPDGSDAPIYPATGSIVLAYTVLPSGSIWSIQPSEVATVDTKGMVTALAPGRAIVTLTEPDGRTATVSVVVTDRGGAAHITVQAR